MFEEPSAVQPMAPATPPKLSGGGFAVFEEDGPAEHYNDPAAHGSVARSPLQVAAGFDTNGDGKVDSLDTTGDGHIDLKVVPLAKPLKPPAAVRPQSFGGGSPTMTFNTKAAMADVHQMFSDPLARDAFHDDGDTNGAGTTTVNFVQGTPADGMVTVTATITGTVIPDKLFVDVAVSETSP